MKRTWHKRLFVKTEAYEAGDDRVRVEAPDLISSVTENELHAPVLDIDFPVWVRPSETPGHFHLFIDKEMAWDDYVRLLRVLGDVGICEQGYVNASIERGATYVAVHPWKDDLL